MEDYGEVYFRLLTSFLFTYIDLLMLCGDVESNPGLRLNSSQSFSVCHWNLNSIVALNFSKIPFLKAYKAVHRHHIICEGFLPIKVNNVSYLKESLNFSLSENEK